MFWIIFQLEEIAALVGCSINEMAFITKTDANVAEYWARSRVLLHTWLTKPIHQVSTNLYESLSNYILMELFLCWSSFPFKCTINQKYSLTFTFVSLFTFSPSLTCFYRSVLLFCQDCIFAVQRGESLRGKIYIFSASCEI